MVTVPIIPLKYAKKDFQSDQEIRWCPGCGDYAVLNAVQQIMPQLGIPKEKIVFVSGIGCSSRFPYYMNTYGFHSIHGRAPGIATGIKAANPDLQVWVATGDGDGLSIGGNHLLHSLRRNVDLKILLFNNRIYGLTKGQYSPTSEMGKMTKSTPFGTVERPVNPISFAIAVGATFVARSVDVYTKHLMDVLKRMAAHKGSAFLEIFQNCNVFNDKAFEDFTEREVRDDQNIALEHGKPLLFGKNRDKGIKLKGFTAQICSTDDPDVLVHDEHSSHAGYAFLLSRLVPPDFPMPIGIFRQVQFPTMEERIYDQIATARKKLGEGDLKSLLLAGDIWQVT